MANFSVNQVRQLFVLKEEVTDKDEFEALVGIAANAGKFFVIKPGDGSTTKDCRIAVINAKGEMVVSPVMNEDNVMYGDLNPAGTMTYPKKKVTVKLTDAYLKQVTAEGDDAKGPISGQDYILRVYLNQYFTDSDEDQYIKFGCVHATATMTSAQFYVKMAKSLFLNFSREQFMPVDIYAGATLVTKNNVKTLETTVTNADKIVIVAKELPWVLGKIPFKTLDFDVMANNIILDDEEVCWSEVDDITVEYDTANAEKNSKMIADLEYFCHGSRGDVYRNVCWPYNIDTEYQVNGKSTTGYDVLNIHVAYVGDNEAVQKSEKDITFVAEAGTVISGLKTALPSGISDKIVSHTV